MGLLTGLGGLGLGNLEGMSLYDNPKKPEIPEIGDRAPEVTIKESDFLFEKSFKCVVCNKDFKALTVKTGKAKLIGTDIDLRAKYEHIEPAKYDVVMCPSCGCAAVSRYWGNLTDTQAKNIRTDISRAFKPKIYSQTEYTFDEAFERYQMALANAIVKSAKASEKAYICLKTGWLLRSKAEALNPETDNYETELASIKESEDEFLKNALEGLLTARRTEDFPICGMNEGTVDYLIAALSVRFKEYEQAAKLVGNLLVSRSANPRMKDKARELKEIIQTEVKEKNN